MKNFLSVLFLFFCYLSFAQESFLVKTEGTYDFNEPHELILKPDGNMLFLVNSINEYTYQCAGDIYEVDPQGNIIQRIVFSDPDILYPFFFTIIAVEDTIYVFGVGKTNDVNEYPVLLMRKMDMQLNVIQSNNIRLRIENFNFFQADGVVKYSEGIFEGFGGVNVSNNINVPLLFKVSKNGELLELIQDNTLNGWRLTQDFLFREDDQGYYAFIYNYNAGMEVNTYMYSYDKYLNIDSFYPIPKPLFMYSSAMSINDSSFFLAGAFDDSYPYSMFRMGLMKMKTDGTIIDEFLYDIQGDTAAHPAYFNSFDTCSDGTIIFCGINNLKTQMVHQYEPASILLFKLNKNLDVKWQRYIGADDGKYDAFSVQVTPEDDIVILGAFDTIPVTNLHYNRPMFIRTNTDGLITGFSETNTSFYCKEAIVYPNPARTFVTVDFSMAYPNALFTLCTISGKLVSETWLTSNRQDVDISGLAPGTYLYTLYNSKGLNESGKLVVE